MGRFWNATAAAVLASVAASLLLGVSQQARAADEAATGAAASAETGGLQEIKVTATRVETSIQDTPLAISAISGDALREAGVVDPRQLSGLAPNIYVEQGLGGGVLRPAIRGVAGTDVGAGAIGPVATYIDDVYQPFQFGSANQMYDLNRVEVLRGPQGTLFGKNTTGGALLFYSQAPTDAREGYLTLDGGGGDFTRYAGEGAVNIPLTDTLSSRVSFRVSHRDDYIDNLAGGRELGHTSNYNLRAQLAWRASEDTRVNLTLAGVDAQGDGPIYFSKYYSNPCDFGVGFYVCDENAVASPDAPNSRQTYAEVPNYEDYHRYSAALKVEHQMGGYALTSITGAQKGLYKVQTNDDGLAVDYFHSALKNETWQVSEELRLASPQDAPLKAVMGVFGMYDDINVHGGYGGFVNEPFPYLSANRGTQKTTTLAAFGSVTYDITSQFAVIGGARYSSEKKRIVNELLFPVAREDRPFTDADMNFDYLQANFPFDPDLDYSEAERDSHTWNKLTWDFTANYKPTNEAMLYAKVGTGFLSGGYTLPAVAPGTFAMLKPETMRSYEVGFKTQWLDDRLRFNGDVFHSKYEDMQVTITQFVGGIPTLVRQNAAAARVTGVELEIVAAPIKQLQVSLSGGYADAKYDEYQTVVLGAPVDLKDNRLPYAPKVTGNLGVQYQIPVGANHLTLGTDWSYRDRVFFDPNNFAVTSDPARVTGNVRATFGQSGPGWRVTGYVDNVTNENIIAYGYSTTDTSFTTGNQAVVFTGSTYAPRRLWGLQVGLTF